MSVYCGLKVHHEPSEISQCWRVFALSNPTIHCGGAVVFGPIRYRDQTVVGKNRVNRLMKAHSLFVKKNDRLRAKRCSNRPKPRANAPNQYGGIDMIKVKLSSWGYVYIHGVLDWYTKEIVGHFFSSTSQTSDWKMALNQASIRHFAHSTKKLGSRDDPRDGYCGKNK